MPIYANQITLTANQATTTTTTTSYYWTNAATTWTTSTSTGVNYTGTATDRTIYDDYAKWMGYDNYGKWMYGTSWFKTAEKIIDKKSFMDLLQEE